jgi:hypothetical protein
MRRFLLTILLLLPAFPVDAAVVAGMYGQGRAQFSLVGGNGYAYNNNYFFIGVSASYYVLDGLGVGISFEKWSNGDPGITKYAPFVQYVFYQTSSAIQPYVGAFYRHTVVDGQPDMNSFGERAGVNIVSGPNAYISLGFVQEVYLNCDEAVYVTCRETYPELGITFGF